MCLILIIPCESVDRPTVNAKGKTAPNAEPAKSKSQRGRRPRPLTLSVDLTDRRLTNQHETRGST
jgi:hypothetical protein